MTKNINDLVASRYVKNAEKIPLLSRERSDSESTLSKGCTMGPNPYKIAENLFKVAQNIFKVVAFFIFYLAFSLKVFSIYFYLLTSTN